MKTFKLLLILLIINMFAHAQDTLYVVKTDLSYEKFCVADINRLTFVKPQDFGTYTDSEGHLYHYITIGTQTWMIENLRSSKFRNGDPITNITDNTEWQNQLYTTRIPGWCNYENNAETDAKYGKLYNWFAIEDQRNIAPVGWHVASSQEWLILMDYLISKGFNFDGSKSDVGNKLAKAMASTSEWLSSDVEGSPGNESSTNNSSGFNGIPAGYRSSNGVFSNSGSSTSWWTSTNASEVAGRPAAYNHGIQYNSSYVQMGARYGTYNTHTFGFSVRCVKNKYESYAPVLTTELYTLEGTTAKIISRITDFGNEPVLRYGISGEWQAGICWSNNPEPTLTDHVVRTNDYQNMLQLLSVEKGKTYYVRAFATNTIGTGYSPQITFTVPADTIPATVTDIDGNTYKTVKIGNQVWMAENLRTIKYRNGDLIQAPPVPNIAGSAWQCALTDAKKYGRLYNSRAVLDSRKIAPEGWHVATNEEWNTLIIFLGGKDVAGGKLKESGTTNWSSPNEGATNETGFNALPGGYRDYSYQFVDQTRQGVWWAAGADYNSMHVMSLSWLYTNVFNDSFTTLEEYGYSVRCVKD
jgi:uncharacterized protein (TIGR02145 family)